MHAKNSTGLGNVKSVLCGTQGQKKMKYMLMAKISADRTTILCFPQIRSMMCTGTSWSPV